MEVSIGLWHSRIGHFQAFQSSISLAEGTPNPIFQLFYFTYDIFSEYCKSVSQCIIIFWFKNYLHYKTIASQNVLSETQVKRFFVSKKIYVLFSRYSSFCIFDHPMIYQICDIMMSISTWDRMHFQIYLLNHTSLTHQTWSIDRYKLGQYFSEMFSTIWRTGDKFQSPLNLATCYNYSRTNYIKFPVFHFMKVWIRENYKY